ncbi:DoxX family protein [Paenibacillus sp. L3-i20]|uniref:DoxX family protein n=1 Tax=Paenibacillus sp. L3-i20 TaxID=2905833 RepID=UPI001EDFFD24|nr:DoxX family protein [Paenibacillus sp. L3-i20]GKU77369.1 hypothetical protein L3i20_v217660 [Paenibacillus sp. L3-i20]
MSILTLVFQCLLIVVFLFSGLSKVKGAKMQVETFRHLGLPQWFRAAAGYIVLVGVAGLIIGFWHESILFLAGMWISCIMLGAVLSHIRVKDSFKQMFPALLLMIIVFLFSLLNYSAGSIF